MPRGDRTGPWGMGPRTGRAAGYCAGYPAPGFMNPLPRGGFGRGRGFGRGMSWRRGFGWGRRAWNYPTQPVPAYPTQYQPQMTKEQERQFLEQDIKALEAEQKDLNQELEAVRKRLKELKK